MDIPSRIQSIVCKKRANLSTIGQSGASVRIYDDMVLKIQVQSNESDREFDMMRWLQGKLPVPKIIEQISSNKLSYLLMSKCSGKMACSNVYMQQPKYQAELLAGALNDIWRVDLSQCPYNSTLKYKLKNAEYNVINNLVDVNDCNPKIFSKGGFKDPEALLYWLQNNKPNEEFVLSHGDFCLPNIFFDRGVMTGLIDLGRCGIADTWCDIALCYRSITDNYNGRYGIVWPGYSKQILF